MKIYIFYLLFGVVLLLSGCGEDEGSEDDELTSSSVTQGWHFQGRDCLACHNVDLAEERHLLFGGSVYKDANIINQDDINNTCGGELLVKFLDTTTGATLYNSKNYKAVNSPGYNAKGNIFILQRELRLLSAGAYYIQITDANGSIMAASGAHQFTSQDYNIHNPVDFNNRLSCNSCHIKGGIQSPLYIQVNKNLCK